MEQSPMDSEVTVPETSPTFLPTVVFPLYISPPSPLPCVSNPNYLSLVKIITTKIPVNRTRK